MKSSLFSSKISSIIFILSTTAILITCPASGALVVRELSSQQQSVDYRIDKREPSSSLKIDCTTTPKLVRFAAEVNSLNFSTSEEGMIWRIEDEGVAGIDGMPDLPAVSRWVAVSATGDLSLSVSVHNQTRRSGDVPARFRNLEEEGKATEHSELLALTGLWPPQVAIMSQPMVWRGIRLVNLVIYPVQWDADAQEYVLNEGVTTEIIRGDGVGENEVVPGYREPCRDFDLAIRSLVVNPPARDDSDESYPPGSYLVVANENYPEVVDDFIEWKRESGHKVQVLTFDPQIIVRAQLKNLISEIYAESSFSFLVFMGNEEVEPPLRIPYDNEFYDNYFGQLDGNDPIADVAVGTYNCLTAVNLGCAIGRTISYEKEPDIENAEWFGRGFVGVGHCSVPEDLSPSYTGKWVKEVLERRGYEVASTFFSDNNDNDFSPDVARQYNNGVNLILVRGHQSEFQPGDISNERGVFPFHFMVSSSTISPGGWGSFNRTFRIGTPDDMRGPSAGFGHYPSPRTNIANAIVGGLVEGLFHKGIRSFGWARQYLTAKIPIVMPADQGQLVTRYWGTLRYYGDPGQEPWIGEPRQVEVEHGALRTGQSSYRVRVHIGDEPIQGANVTLYDPDNLQITRSTDAAGIADFSWDNPDFAPQQPILTVTGEGIYPFQEQLEGEGQPSIVVSDYEIYDATHNEVELNPGDRAGLRVTFTNLTVEGGSDPFQINWVCTSPYVSGQFQATQVPRLGIGESVEIEFQPAENNPARILSETPNRTRIESNIPIETSKGMHFEVLAPDLGAEQVNHIAGNLLPGGNVRITVTLQNGGEWPAMNVQGRLTAISSYVDVADGAAQWSDIDVGETVDERDDLSFIINENAIPGSVVELMLEVDTDTRIGMQIPISINLVNRQLEDPIGPDKYGYIGIENGDNNTEWADAPEYRWINISSWGGGDFQGTLLDFPLQGETDSSVVVDLPFNFRYYGTDFRQITVCNNGWIAMGNQTGLKNQQNWPLPGYNGAWGMIAPFWDRLNMRTRSDGVFIYFDDDADRLIIQWQTGVLDNGGNWFANAFQIILFDPEHYETATGDSPFLFQYDTVNDVSGDFEANFKCSVGISSPDGEDGLTYAYWGMNPRGSRNIAANRAILWTTAAWQARATLEGRVVRYIDSTAVAGAEIQTSNGLQALTNGAGEYRIIAPGAEGLTVTARADRYGEISVEGVNLVDGEVVQQDFVLPHGWLAVPEDTIVLSSVFRDENWAIGRVIFRNNGNLSARVSFELVVPDSSHWTDSLAFHNEGESDTVSVEPAQEAAGRFGVTGDVSGEFTATLRLHTDTPVAVIDRPLKVYILSVVEADTELPKEYALAEPYPNPFNSQTTLRFSLPEKGNVRLILTDVLGRKVRKLTETEYQAGSYRLTMDAGDLPTGLYIIRMEAGSFKASERLLLLR